MWLELFHKLPLSLFLSKLSPDTFRHCCIAPAARVRRVVTQVSRVLAKVIASVGLVS
jgi:hypothetical protein